MLYFAYGANLNQAGMLKRCPGHTPISKGVLKGYRLTFRGVADITPCPTSEVLGAVYDITEANRIALDHFEGYPRMYIRIDVQVTLESGETVTAMAYKMVESIKIVCPPNLFYLQTIKQGYQHWKLPQAGLNKTVDRATQEYHQKGQGNASY